MLKSRRTKSPHIRESAMSGLDTKYLRAAVVLMEELNFSRAATKLNIGQSALSKQISHLHEHLGYELFVREGRKITATAAGEAYAAEAKLSLHAERAVSLSRAANQKSEIILHIGKSPYTDPYLITKVLSLRPPVLPKSKPHANQQVCCRSVARPFERNPGFGVSYGYA